MMSRRILFGVAAGMLLVALLVTAPLILVTRLAGSSLSEAVVYGSVWQGRIYGASFERAALDEIEVTLRPASLLVLRPTYEWQINDAETRGSGLAFAGVGKRGLSDSTLTTSFSGLGLNLPAIDPQEVITLQLDELVTTADGCEAANGSVRTAALFSIAAQYDLQAPTLAGPIQCEQGVLRLNLSGEAEDMRVALDVFLPANGHWRWAASVETTNARLGSVLTSAGFQREAGVWRGRGDGGGS